MMMMVTACNSCGIVYIPGAIDYSLGLPVGSVSRLTRTYEATVTLISSIGLTET